uniref:TATA-binding protein-associated factor 2N n=1 Tax=Anthurium amnicola TaxID=1678845 RepID=A0A1D1YA43_9ARAE
MNIRYGGVALVAGYGTHAGSLSPSPQQKSKYHRYDPDAEDSGELQCRRRSPYPRRLENHHYDPDFDQPEKHDHRSPHLRRTPDHSLYGQEYVRVRRPHGRGSPLRRRFDRHHYDPNYDRLLEHGRVSSFQRRPDPHHDDYGFEQTGPEHGHEFWGERVDGRFRDLSPTYGRGRKFRDGSPSYGCGRGGGRFHDVSPPYGRGRGGGRFRDVSPPYFHVGDERYDRGFDEHEPGDMHVRGEHRNDPNLAPRVGDWICKNPSCGNLNFARRESCNKCNKFRLGYVDGGPRSPRPGYSGPPSPHGPPPRFSGPLHDRGTRRDANGYRSPPNDWTGDSPKGPPPPRNGGKFRGPGLQRGKSGYHEDDGPRERDRFDRTLPNRERYEFIHERRGYDRRPLSPPGRWENGPQERSRSPPPRVRSPRKDFRRNSYMGRGQGDRYRAWQE